MYFKNTIFVVTLHYQMVQLSFLIILGPQGFDCIAYKNQINFVLI